MNLKRLLFNIPIWVITSPLTAVILIVCFGIWFNKNASHDEYISYSSVLKEFKDLYL